MIGDPSGKSKERNLLDEATLAHNVSCIKAQLEHFLDFNSDAPNAAELVNNYDWMKDYTFLDFARNVGKLITVNYMMAKDSVKKRSCEALPPRTLFSGSHGPENIVPEYTVKAFPIKFISESSLKSNSFCPHETSVNEIIAIRINEKAFFI